MLPPADNPFTPTFGITPPLLVGREPELAAVRRALTRGPGDPARAVFLTGPRGTGKTVLLNALEDVAAEVGWAVLTETVQPGLADALTHTLLPQLLAAADGGSADAVVTGLNATVLGVGAGVTRQVRERHPVEPTLRQQLEALARRLADRGGGLFVSLDEVHRRDAAELRPLFHAVQHCFRQGLPVAFAAAGLPSAVSGLLSDDVLTYLRRAERFTLGPLPETLVRAAIRQPIVQAGRAVADEALDLAVDAVKGYAFLIQVVGFELWEADPTAPAIGLAAARVALPRVSRTAARLVYEPALQDISAHDRRFLRAMAADGLDPTPVAAIMNRLGATRSHLNKYRARLIAAQLIEPAGRGLLRFAIPFLREHLRAADSSADEV
jgi:hypothetical protein